MSPHRHGARAASTLPFLVVLMLALVEFGQVWYYPGGERGVEVTRAFGGAFRLLLWVLASAAILMHLLRRGPRPMLRVLWPFAAFLLWGAIVVVFWSVDRITGARALIFWSLASGLAAAAGHELDPRTLARGVAILFCSIVAASLALAVFLPEAAYTYYGDAFVVRGLFPHKNQLGWYCAVGLLWSVALRRDIGAPILAIAVPVLLAGLVTADSTTALAIVVAAAGFAMALALTARLFWNGARASLALIVATVGAAAVVALLAPALLDQFGRDATLTGRTDVWRHYLSYVQDRSLTGFGTGIFSTGSEMNLEIGGTVPGYEHENLHSPHNLYIGLAGETGLIGVVFFLFAQLYLAFAAPFQRMSAWLRLSGALAFAIMFAGLAEMRDGYSPGVATVALLAARASGLRAAREREPSPKINPIAQAL